MTEKTEIWALGLMSGTSLDGVDGAMIRTDGNQIAELGDSVFRPYTLAEQDIVREALGKWQNNKTLQPAHDIIINASPKTSTGMMKGARVMPAPTPTAILSVLGCSGILVSLRVVSRIGLAIRLLGCEDPIEFLDRISTAEREAALTEVRLADVSLVPRQRFASPDSLDGVLEIAGSQLVAERSPFRDFLYLPNGEWLLLLTIGHGGLLSRRSRCCHRRREPRADGRRDREPESGGRHGARTTFDKGGRGYPADDDNSAQARRVLSNPLYSVFIFNRC